MTIRRLPTAQQFWRSAHFFENDLQNRGTYDRKYNGHKMYFIFLSITVPSTYFAPIYCHVFSDYIRGLNGNGIYWTLKTCNYN
jgi:hypothetical protein